MVYQRTHVVAAILLLCLALPGLYAQQCRSTCRPPDCSCPRLTYPMPTRQIPQMVYFGFDDAVNVVMSSLYERVFTKKRKNPNGCRMKMSLYVSHQYTDYKKVKMFYDQGNEIGVHSVTHNSIDNDEILRKEAKQQKENIIKAGIPEKDIVGWRSPFLKTAGLNQPKILKELGFTYDISLTYTRSDLTTDKPWPFTMDHGWPYACGIEPCPIGAQVDNFWAVPVNSLMDHKNKYPCPYVDGCAVPALVEQQAYDYLWKNFLSYYNTTRAPFGLHMHAAWFYRRHNLKAMMRFLDDLMKFDDVYVVTAKQMLDWMKHPTPVGAIDTLQSWQCAESRSGAGGRKHKVAPTPKPRQRTIHFSDLFKSPLPFSARRRGFTRNTSPLIPRGPSRLNIRRNRPTTTSTTFTTTTPKPTRPTTTTRSTLAPTTAKSTTTTTEPTTTTSKLTTTTTPKPTTTTTPKPTTTTPKPTTTTTQKTTTTTTPKPTTTTTTKPTTTTPKPTTTSTQKPTTTTTPKPTTTTTPKPTTTTTTTTKPTTTTQKPTTTTTPNPTTSTTKPTTTTQKPTTTTTPKPTTTTSTQKPTTTTTSKPTTTTPKPTTTTTKPTTTSPKPTTTTSTPTTTTTQKPTTTTTTTTNPTTTTTEPTTTATTTKKTTTTTAKPTTTTTKRTTQKPSTESLSTTTTLPTTTTTTTATTTVTPSTTASSSTEIPTTAKQATTESKVIFRDILRPMKDSSQLTRADSDSIKGFDSAPFKGMSLLDNLSMIADWIKRTPEQETSKTNHGHTHDHTHGHTHGHGDHDHAMDTNNIAPQGHKQDIIRTTTQPPISVRQYAHCIQGVTCHLPSCYCQGNKIPNNLNPTDTPQMVIITIDGAINPRVYQRYRQLFNNRRNPNNCRARGTIFSTETGSNPSMIRKVVAKGAEIAMQGLHEHHFDTVEHMEQEIIAQNRSLRRNGVRGVVGWKTPELKAMGDEQFRLLKKHGFKYDATLSMTLPRNGNKNPWPFTLDYGFRGECVIPQCPTKRFPGIWEVPSIPVLDYKKMYECAYVDGCMLNPPSANATESFLMNNFLYSYNSNRAPFGLHLRQLWFSHNAYKPNIEGLRRFMNKVMAMKDVYLVSTSDVIQWMQNPTPLSAITKQTPWNCS